MKFCNKCKVELTPENHHNVTNLLCKRHYIEDVSERNRRHRAKQHLRRKKYEAKHNKTKERKDQFKEIQYRMIKKYPEKWKARAKLRYAVKTGKIIKPEMCDKSIMSDLICKGRLEGHHHLGYEGEHWKDVQWLCRSHHVKAHFGSLALNL